MAIGNTIDGELARTKLNIAPPPCPSTQGIKYAGSKARLLPQILALIEQTGANSALDGFAGTTRVSQALALTGRTVICNDTAAWSRIFGACYLLNERPAEYYVPLIAHLNALPPASGWFTERYGSSLEKQPWQRHNTEKLDAIREEIERLALPPIERAVALTSLILALDQVDSTLGHHASYLRTWSPRSYNSLRLEVPQLIQRTAPHEVHQRDVFEIAREAATDVAYFDPPYGSNNEKMPPSRVRYAAYYHLWTSICLYDKPPLFGKANRRADSSDLLNRSVFEEFRKGDDGKYLAVQALGTLMRQTAAPWIILSYSSGGRATAAELREIIADTGELVSTVEIPYKKNVMAQMRWTDQWTNAEAEPNREFLFLIRKK